MKKARVSIVLATVMALVLAMSACSKKAEAPASTEPVAQASTEAPPAGGGATAEVYADSVCTALADWITEIQTSGQDMPTDMTDASSAQAALVDFLDGLVTATQSMISDIESVGAPDVEGGEEAHQQILASLQNVEDIFTSASETVSNLDTADPQAFGQALTQIGTDMQEASTGATAGLDSISNAELDSAFQNNPACQGLTGAGAAMEGAPTG